MEKLSIQFTVCLQGVYIEFIFYGNSNGENTNQLVSVT